MWTSTVWFVKTGGVLLLMYICTTRTLPEEFVLKVYTITK